MQLDAWLTSHGVTQIIDLRNALTDPRDFEDEDHLNETGAAKAVKILEERLQRRITSSAPSGSARPWPRH